MKEFLKANKGCVLAIVLISPVVVAFFEYIFYYHVQYRTENVKCVYDIIGAGLQTCLYQMAVIFIPFTMVYFFKGCYRYGIIIRQTQLKQVWLKMCVKLTKIILAVSVYLTVLICLIPFCFTDVIWNWSAQTSYVYIYGGVDTVYHPSVILVAAGCFTAVFTALMIVCVLMLFFWWVFESPVGGYIVMLLYAAEEMYRGLFFNGRVTMNAVVISEKHIRVFSNFIYPVLVLVGLLIITYILFRKKDLLKKDIYN
jgi:hypothetical protein